MFLSVSLSRMGFWNILALLSADDIFVESQHLSPRRSIHRETGAALALVDSSVPDRISATVANSGAVVETCHRLTLPV